MCFSSEGELPPYLLSDIQNVLSETPGLQQTSGTDVLSSVCSKAKQASLMNREFSSAEHFVQEV